MKMNWKYIWFKTNRLDLRRFENASWRFEQILGIFGNLETQFRKCVIRTEIQYIGGCYVILLSMFRWLDLSLHKRLQYACIIRRQIIINVYSYQFYFAHNWTKSAVRHGGKQTWTFCPVEWSCEANREAESHQTSRPTNKVPFAMKANRNIKVRLM